MKWINAKELGIRGKGFDTIGYRRLTEEQNRIMSEVYPPNTHPVANFPKLGTCSAGLHIDFETDSENISVKWTVRYLDIPDQMGIINQSGMDLYVLQNGKYRFVKSTVFPYKKTNQCSLAENPRYSGTNTYTLNLCSYDEMVELEIGIDDEAIIKPVPPKKDYIAVYGTSITQGGVASRPGMIYTNILRRELNEEFVNMGFCGLGKMDPEMISILTGLDPKLMIIDCLPNMYMMDEGTLRDRFGYFYSEYRKTHPQTPILFIEKPIYSNAWAFTEIPETVNTVLREKFEEWNKDDKNIYYLKGDNLYGSDSEASPDGEHPTDIGFMRMAEIMLPVIKAIIDKE